MKHPIKFFLLFCLFTFNPTYSSTPNEAEILFFKETINDLKQSKISWQEADAEKAGPRLKTFAQWSIFQITLEQALKNKKPLEETFIKELNQWIEQQDPDSYLGYTLSELAISVLTQLKQYPQALSFENKARHTTHVNCRLLESKIQMNQLHTSDIPKHIQTHFKPTQACLPLLQKEYHLPTSWLTKELWSALELQQPSTRNALLNILITPENTQDWIHIKNNPLQWIQTHTHQGKTSFLYRLALQQWILKNKQLTYTQLQPWLTHLNPQDANEVIAYAGLVLALNLNPEAYHVYHHLPKNKALSAYNQEWRIRTELRQKKRKWGYILSLIHQLPKKNQQQSNWLYWKALAQKQTRQPFQKTVKKLIQNHQDYYALLARESFNVPLPKPTRPTKKTSPNWTPSPDLEKAVLLYHIGLPRLAQKQWNHALSHTTKQQKIQAAYWAHQAGAYILSINTHVALKENTLLEVRFPTPDQEILAKEAEQQGVSKAFVYGLIRQESRFIARINSYVGAQGLMQIMPNTAKDIIQKNALPTQWAEQLDQPDINAKLGIRYIQMMYNQFSQRYPLVAIAYNAGPHRAKTWLEKVPHHLPGSVFIESIPFTETRHYVQNVLANMVYYNHIFSNQHLNLHDLIGSFEAQTP